MSDHIRQARENLDWYTNERELAQVQVDSANVEVRKREERVQELNQQIDHWRSILYCRIRDVESATESVVKL